MTSTEPHTEVVRPTGWQRFSNGWPTVPLRLFLAAVFLFGAYAKFTYPGFFDPNAAFGFKSAVASAKADSPISGLLGPMVDHASLFGHITAVAELLIGLGLLVGLLTRIAALGGIALAVLIVLSVNWSSVKEYTGNGGWFTSVDLVMALALTVFVIGGAGPLSLDEGIGLLRRRRRARNEELDRAEPHFHDRDSELADSRRRLAGEPIEPADTASGAAVGTATEPSTGDTPSPGSRVGAASGPSVGAASGPSVGADSGDGEHPTEQLPSVPGGGQRESDSLWRDPAAEDR